MRKRRLIAGVGAGAYGQLVTIVLQLCTVPLFLSQWTVQEYGLWLIVSAAQTYFALTEFGIVSAAGSRMTMLSGRGARVGANLTLHAATTFILGTSLALCTLAPLAGYAFFLAGVPADFSASAGLLVLIVAASQVSGLSFAIYQATGRNHRGLASVANIRLAEWLGGAVGIFSTGSPIGVAAGMLVARIIATAVVTVDSMRGQETFSLGLARWRILRLHLRQSLQNFSITLANSLSLQGVTIVIGIFYGAGDVAIFNIYRTAARIIVQGTGIVSHAAWPEFASLHGSRSTDALRHLYMRVQTTSLALSALASVSFLAGLPLLLELWTHGKIPLSWNLGVSIAIYALLASSWHVPRVLLTAVGSNRSVARVALFSALLVIVSSITLSALAAPIWSQAAAMAAGELLAAVVTTRVGLSWLRSRGQDSSGLLS